MNELIQELKEFMDGYDWSQEVGLSTSTDGMKGDGNIMRNPVIKASHLVAVRSEEYRDNMSKLKTDFVHTEETKQKLSEIAKELGTGKFNLGRPKKESTKKAMSKSASERPRTTCDKCGQGYTNANFKRHYKACTGHKQAQYHKVDGKIQRVWTT